MKSPSTLHIALGVSIAVHAALLTLRFADPQRFDRMFQDTPLEVILVNAQSREKLDKPEQAVAIAQATLAGGGDAKQGRATSPLPPSPLIKPGDAEQDEAHRQIDSLKAQQAHLLLQARQALAAMPPPEPNAPAATAEALAQEEKRQQLVQLLAEIERRVNEENAPPRKRYISPATREAAYAVYYDVLRRKIEERGTQSFPEQNGKKLYGALIMTMTVNFDGSVLATEVVKSSGHPALDRRAQAIVLGAGPFAPFEPAMRRQAEQIVVVSSFNFGRDDSLQTRLGGQ